MRGATYHDRPNYATIPYFNPRSSCEERQETLSTYFTCLLISIHAPHARSDRHSIIACFAAYISIHAPHARSDYGRDSSCSSWMNFNPRSSCEERRAAHFVRDLCRSHFNPRSSCEERRPCRNDYNKERKFQSTLLMRGATRFAEGGESGGGISIHAPHARSDNAVPAQRSRVRLFQSTLLMRGATGPCLQVSPDHHDFNPRSSCEERPRHSSLSLKGANFNPRSSCEERLAGTLNLANNV